MLAIIVTISIRKRNSPIFTGISIVITVSLEFSLFNHVDPDFMKTGSDPCVKFYIGFIRFISCDCDSKIESSYDFLR